MKGRDYLHYPLIYMEGYIKGVLRYTLYREGGGYILNPGN
jgi:hypothetical protein